MFHIQFLSALPRCRCWWSNHVLLSRCWAVPEKSTWSTWFSKHNTKLLALLHPKLSNTCKIMQVANVNKNYPRYLHLAFEHLNVQCTARSFHPTFKPWLLVISWDYPKFVDETETSRNPPRVESCQTRHLETAPRWGHPGLGTAGFLIRPQPPQTLETYGL